MTERTDAVYLDAAASAPPLEEAVRAAADAAAPSRRPDLDPCPRPRGAQRAGGSAHAGRCIARCSDRRGDLHERRNRSQRPGRARRRGCTADGGWGAVRHDDAEHPSRSPQPPAHRASRWSRSRATTRGASTSTGGRRRSRSPALRWPRSSTRAIWSGPSNPLPNASGSRARTAFLCTSTRARHCRHCGSTRPRSGPTCSRSPLTRPPGRRARGRCSSVAGRHCGRCTGDARERRLQAPGMPNLPGLIGMGAALWRPAVRSSPTARPTCGP